MAESNKPSVDIETIKASLLHKLAPLESAESLHVLVDECTGAQYCECHVRGSKFIKFATTDAALDPDEQGDYRANRDVVENAPAFARMKVDAKNKRSFSGIVTEYVFDDQDDTPLKIIGGQHRYQAIEEALEGGVDEWHGLKIYLVDRL